MANNSQIQIDNYQTSDFYRVVNLLNDSLPHEKITQGSFARRVLLDSNYDPAGVFIAKNRLGEVVGFLLALKKERPSEDLETDLERGWITLFCVRPDVQRQGVGTSLFAEAETWLRSQGRNSILISPYTPYYWTPGVDENASFGACQFLINLGYKVISRPLSMRVEFDSDWSIPEWVNEKQKRLSETGNVTTKFEHEHTYSLMEFLHTEFPGDWERHLRETVSDILQRRRFMEDIWLNFQDGKIVGFAQTEDSRFGPFGVHHALRGKGIGVAILFHTLAQMKDRGCKQAWFMWTNDSTAERLYKSAGFQESRRFSIFRKDLI